MTLIFKLSPRWPAGVPSSQFLCLSDSSPSFPGHLLIFSSEMLSAWFVPSLPQPWEWLFLQGDLVLLVENAAQNLRPRARCLTAPRNAAPNLVVAELRNLSTHVHTSPYRHTSSHITRHDLRVSVPVWVQHQWMGSDLCPPFLCFCVRLPPV